MHAAPLYSHSRRFGAESRGVKIPGLAAVYGDAERAAELLHIDIVSRAPDLLVNREDRAHLRMPEGRILSDLPQDLKDHCHPGLVIGAKKRHAVGDDNVIALM